MFKKSSTFIALGIILFSNALPAIADTSSVVQKETSITKNSNSTPQTSSNGTISDSTSVNKNQELQKSQDEKTKTLTTTTVQNKSVINYILLPSDFSLFSSRVVALISLKVLISSTVCSNLFLSIFRLIFSDWSSW